MTNLAARSFLAVVLIFSPSLAFAALQTDEAAVSRYSRQAEQALAARDLEAARVALEKLAHLTPNVPEVHANLGSVYYSEGRYSDALESFQNALKLNPKIPNVTLMVGICEAELGRPQEALSILEPAFRRPPNSEIGRTIGLELLGVYSSTGQHTKALEVIEELLTRYPSDPEVLYRASHVYGDRALETTTRLAQVAPDSPWKRMAFAETLEAQKHYDLAITEYQKVIASDAGIPNVHFRLGRALLLRDPNSDEARDQALQEFQKAVEQDPRNAGAEYEMGEICRHRGDRPAAMLHFSRAVEIDPRFEEAQIALARTLIDLHKPADSVPHLRAAIRLNPSNEVSHFLLAAAYKAMGNAAEYQQEMALYQKYHATPFAQESGRAEQQGVLATPEVTPQTLDSADPP
ncbi:MAG TPA: tetratricopeptide repeat protein [Terriglobia bacterium]|nr:tetratricopeptide repeat protein [Terriglobia bacterium]